MMNRLNIFVLLIFLSANLKASDLRLSLAYDEYLEGKYFSTLEILDSVKPQSDLDVLFSRYLRGLSLSRLGNFRGSHKELVWILNNADKESLAKVPEIYYLLGQVNYAQGNWNQSLKYFNDSLNRKVFPYYSIHYIGHILTLQKKYSMALKVYEKLLYIKENPANVKQMAWYKMAEIHRLQAEAKNFKYGYILNVVLPRYYAGLKINPKSILAKKIRKRIDTLSRKVGTDSLNIQEL